MMKANRKKRSRTLLRLSGAAVLAAMLSLSGAAAGEEAPALLEPVGVQLDTATAYIGEIAQISVYNGSVRPYVEELYFTLNGTVGEVHVVVGQQVKAGDALVTLDQEAEEKRMEKLRKSIEQQKTIDAYDAQLEEIKLAMLEAELNQLRSTGAGQDAIALKELDIEEEKLDQAFAQELRRMNLTALEDELARLEQEALACVLRAPFDGRVMYGTALQKGSYINAYNPILYLADDTQLSVESEYISKTYLGSAHEIYALIGAQRYEVTPVEIDQTEYVSKALSGETLTTEFSLDAPDEALRAGQYAAVCLVTKYKPDALLVPSNAIYHDASGWYVYVVEGEERIRTGIRAGITTDWLVEITEGIEEGAVVYVKE